MSARAKCLGVVGLLCGHKFYKNHPWFIPEFVQHHDHCVRCGMPKGGWSEVSP